VNTEISKKEILKRKANLQDDGSPMKGGDPTMTPVYGFAT
jgi:hypothetical protein